MNALKKISNWFGCSRSHPKPVTKQDLQEMEDRLLLAIQGADAAKLQQLTEQLRKGDDSLAAVVKANQPENK